MRSSFVFVVSLSLMVGILLIAPQADAQDLEPRAFSPAPKGMNFAMLSYGYSTGNIFFDPAIPIEDAEGTVQSLTLAYVRTLSFFGKSAKLAGVLPRAWGDWEGNVDGEFRTRTASGFADPGLQLTVNFVGAPAMTMQDMAQYKEGTIVGAILLVRLPLGQYDSDKLINLGTNRWTIVPRLGVSHRVKRWTFEAICSASFYTDNNDAYQDSELSQAPLFGLVADVIYQFKRGLWMGFGAGVGTGARTTVSGVPKDTYQQNVRLGLTFVYPMSKHSSLKAVFLRSPSTKRGADFDTVSLAYQARWGGGL